MKNITSLAAFDSCRKIINLFKNKDAKVSNQDIYQFIGNSDKFALRLTTNFKPLQTIFQQLTPRLISDDRIINNQKTFSSVMNIYCFLNLYDRQWMTFSIQQIINFMKKDSNLGLQCSISVYRAIVELKHMEHPIETKILRQFCGQAIMSSLAKWDEQSSETYTFYKFIEKLHIHLKFLIIDPSRDVPLIESIIEQLRKLFQICSTRHSMLEKTSYPFYNSASIYELSLVYSITLPSEGQYIAFLKRSYQKNLISLNSQTSTSKEYKSKGQSVFQIRFQKHLIENGFWFKRNLKIGIHQYDILIKGTQRKQYFPFRNLKIKDFQYQQFKTISQKEKKLFEKTLNEWYLQDLQLYDDKILVNLSGPYHYLSGDKGGLMRSQEIKSDIAKYYGYNRFKNIDFKQWERDTPNKRKITQFLNKIVSE